MKSKLSRKRKPLVEGNDNIEEPKEKNLKLIPACELRSKLRGPSPCITSLRSFLQGDSQLERIGDYINEGGSIAELLVVLNNIDIRKDVNAAVTVFKAVRLFVIKCLSEYPAKHSQLVEECRQLLSIHLQYLLSLLGNTYSVKLKRVSLELLTVIVTCHESLGWEVIGKCSISKLDLGYLVSASRYNDPSSVRETFIHFLLSFLIDQSPGLIKKVISKRGLLTSIFPGLVHDSFENVILLLDAFKKNVVDVKEISKSVRLMLFNTSTICNLFELFDWDPTFGSTQAGRVDPSKKELIRQKLEALLIDLLTSLKTGVIFPDLSLGTSGKVVNDLVFNLVKALGQPWGDNLKEKVYIKMICACPDVIKEAYKQFEPYLNSQPHKWCQVVNFMSDLILALDLNINNLSDRLKTRIKHLYAPEFLLKSLSLTLKSDLKDQMCSSALRCLCICLSKLKSLIKVFRDPSVTDYLINNLAGTAEHLLYKIILNAKSFSIEDLLNSIECLLYLYDVCPQLLDAIRFKDEPNEEIKECIELIKKADIESDSDEVVKRNLACLKLIEIILILWNVDYTHDEYGFWLEDVCHLMSSPPNETLLSIGLKVMDLTLSSTGFLSGSGELKLWLYSISINCNINVGKLILLSLNYATQHIKSLYKDMKIIETNVSLVDHLDVKLSLDDYIRASQSSETIDTVSSSTVDTICSNSIFLLSLLKTLNQSPDDFKSSQSFVTNLLVHIFHHHPSPQLYFATLKYYSLYNGVKKVIKYVEMWISGRGESLSSIASFKNTIFDKASIWLLNNCSQDDIDDNPLEWMCCLTDSEADLISKQCLFYLSFEKINPQRGAYLIKQLVSRRNNLASTLLSNQIIFSMFSPLNDSKNSFNNSTPIALELIKFSHDSRVVQFYQHKFAFELRCCLLKNSSLKRCHTVCDLIDLIGVPNKEVIDLITQCCPLPERCLKGYSNWFQIIAYLLQKCVEIDAKLSDDKLLLLIEQVSFMLEKLTPEMFICDALALYLSNFKKEISIISKDHLSLINELLIKLCLNNIWFENLATELSVYTSLTDFSVLPLERTIPLLLNIKDEDVICRELSSKLEENYENICNKMFVPNPDYWISQLCSLIRNYNVSERSLKKLKSKIMKKYKDISLVVESFKLICIVLEKGGFKSELFSLIEHHIINYREWENEELLNLLIGGLGVLIKQKCQLNHAICKYLILEGVRRSNSKMIFLLNSAILLELTETEVDKIFALLTSHSLFLDTILDGDSEVKSGILQILIELLKRDKTLMKSSHIPVYLGAYNASLTKPDQLILKLLLSYEENGISFLEWKPLVWGQLAAQSYSVREVRKRVDVTNSPTIDLIDMSRVNSTLTNYPSTRSYDQNLFLLDHVDQDQLIYDPVFILPVIAQAIGPTSDVHPRRVTVSGALSLALRSLNSTDPQIRSIGYHILHKFYQSLTNRSCDSIWLNFIETLQRSLIGQENVRLSGYLSLFLARASIIMMEPLNPLYKPIHNFILAKECLRFEDVPAFFELFHCKFDDKNITQIWILEVIRDGITDLNDFQIALRSNTIKLLLSFYNSDLSSILTKQIIEEILTNCLKYGDNKHCFLTKEYSLIPWLIFVDKLQIAFETIPNINKFIN